MNWPIVSRFLLIKCAILWRFYGTNRASIPFKRRLHCKMLKVYITSGTDQRSAFFLERLCYSNHELLLLLVVFMTWARLRLLLLMMLVLLLVLLLMLLMLVLMLDSRIKVGMLLFLNRSVIIITNCVIVEDEMVSVIIASMVRLM